MEDVGNPPLIYPCEQGPMDKDLLRAELERLAQILREEQRRLLEGAAASGTMPAARTLDRVAVLELNISAIENTLIDED